MKARGFFLMSVAVSIALFVAAAGASAHSDDGTIETLQLTHDGRFIVTIQVRISFAGDGHPAGDATATINAERPDGSSVGPTPLTSTSITGVYAARMVLPAAGVWSLRVTSLNPTAFASGEIEVGEVRSEPIASGPATTPGPGPTSPAPDATSPVPTTQRLGLRREDESDEQRVATTALFVGILIAFAAAAGGLVRSSRRARGGSERQ